MSLTKYRNRNESLFNLMDTFFDSPFSMVYAPSERTSMNVVSREGGYDYEFSIPGFNKSEVDVSVDNKSLLTVRGEKKYAKEDKKYCFSEFSSSSFVRSVKLPESANTEAIKASVADGILTVSVPTQNEKTVNKIEIT